MTLSDGFVCPLFLDRLLIEPLNKRGASWGLALCSQIAVSRRCVVPSLPQGTPNLNQKLAFSSDTGRRRGQCDAPEEHREV